MVGHDEEERIAPVSSEGVGDEPIEGLAVAQVESTEFVIDIAEAPSTDRDVDPEEPDPTPAPPDETVDLREPAGPGSRRRLHRERQPGPLEGRVAVVSGGGEGLGRVLALALLDAGARVCLLGRDTVALRETIELAGRRAPALYLQCDLGSVTEIESAADFIGRFDRPVDLLVHAAAVRVPQGLASGSVSDLDEQYLVNLRGPYALTQRLMGSLTAGPGHVFMLDRPAFGDVVDVQHVAIMAGLRTMAQGVRDEVSGTGVRVTTVTVEPGTDDLEVAACILASATSSPGVEISEVRVRSVAPIGAHARP